MSQTHGHMSNGHMSQTHGRMSNGHMSQTHGHMSQTHVTCHKHMVTMSQTHGHHDDERGAVRCGAARNSLAPRHGLIT